MIDDKSKDRPTQPTPPGRPMPPEPKPAPAPQPQGNEDNPGVPVGPGKKP